MGAAAAIPVAPTARLIKLAPGTNGALAVAQAMGAPAAGGGAVSSTSTRRGACFGWIKAKAGAELSHLDPGTSTPIKRGL